MMHVIELVFYPRQIFLSDVFLATYIPGGLYLGNKITLGSENLNLNLKK